MFFEVYSGVSDLPEKKLSFGETQLRDFLNKQLIAFPINRVKLRKNYSENSFKITLDIELDSILTSERLFNSITFRLFKALNVKKVTIENSDGFSNFKYFFYGENTILDYHCSMFVDIPIKAYMPQRKVKHNSQDDFF
jgi:hypothetical protein